MPTSFSDTSVFSQLSKDFSKILKIGTPASKCDRREVKIQEVENCSIFCTFTNFFLKTNHFYFCSTTSTTNSDHSTSPSPELLSRPKFNINEPVSSYSASSNSAISTTPVSARFSSLQSHSSSGLVNVPRLASIQETSRVMESIEQKSAISAVSANQRSIHESGLPVIGPKPIQTPPPSLLLANGSRGSITSFSNIANLRVTFHDYENYFYI